MRVCCAPGVATDGAQHLHTIEVDSIGHRTTDASEVGVITKSTDLDRLVVESETFVRVNHGTNTNAVVDCVQYFARTVYHICSDSIQGRALDRPQLSILDGSARVDHDSHTGTTIGAWWY